MRPPVGACNLDTSHGAATMNQETRVLRVRQLAWLAAFVFALAATAYTAPSKPPGRQATAPF